MVIAQSPARFALSKVRVVSDEFILSQCRRTSIGVENTTTQGAAGKQLDIFFKENNVLFISGDILLL
jgi:hypothetical protein